MRVSKVITLHIGLFLASLIFMVSSAQSERVLVPDQPINGSVNADNVAQIYTFAGSEGAEVTLLLTPQTNLALTMLVTDASGNPVEQIIGSGAESDLTIEAIILPETSTYYVTIFPTAAAETPSTGGAFILTLETSVTLTPIPETPDAEATETVATTPTTQDFQPGQQVLLGNGIEVTLNWDTTDDLNLQIRDPVGGTLFWDSRFTDDGGSFGLDTNGLCEILASPASETATWPGGGRYAGSYEILVYYRQACEGNNPVDFTVNVTVDGQVLDPISGTILPPINNQSNVFISSFTVNQDGDASVGLSGRYIGTNELDVDPLELVNRESPPLLIDQPQIGLITNDNAYQTYSYEGLAGEIINVSLTATNGSLDTLLIVLNSSGNVIASNDDIISAANTNSAIDSLRLPAEGVYTIVATRYGKLVGGTQGNFEILVSGSALPTELLELDLPSGDIEITLTWQSDADLQLLVRDPSGRAIYDDFPSAPSGGTLTSQGNVNCILAEGNPVSYIYWPDDFLRIGSYEIEVWFQSTCNVVENTFFNIYVVVEGELILTDNVNINFNERYVVSFNIDQTGIATVGLGGITGGSETLNYAVELPSAVRIQSGQSVQGSITPDDKFDLYIFEGRAGDLITIDMQATSGTLDTLLFLIDPNGIEIAANDDANETTNSLIANILLSQDGEYIIIATHYGTIFGGTIGGYNLSLRVDG